jgi:hypothetical protein
MQGARNEWATYDAATSVSAGIYTCVSALHLDVSVNRGIFFYR